MKASDSAVTTLNVSLPGVLFRTLGNKNSRKAMFAYLGTVLRDFFFLQFAVKFGFKKIPVISVDHQLDRTVPFTPEKVSVYLDFIAFWVRPLGYIGKRCGKEAQQKYSADFLALVDRCYREAAEVYRFRMTTTDRPKYIKGKFLAIHLFDPHFMCVPSLHVIIVVLAYTFYRKAFAELGLDAAEREILDRELFVGAVATTETVLYIKQHSVNCIPAALYAMTHICPEEVTPTEVMRFIDSLFANAADVSPENAAKIRTHIADLYEELFLEGCHDEGWITPIQRWLNAYSLEGFVR